MTVTGINIVAMLSVERCHRPNALAFLMLSSHILGDVPLPIILGFIKDKLAPACKVDSSGDFSDPEQCKEQEIGVRQSLAIAYAWLFWCVIFYEMSRRLAMREMKREIGEERISEVNDLLLKEQESNEDDDGSDRVFKYYHSRFAPGADESSPLTGNAPKPESIVI